MKRILSLLILLAAKLVTVATAAEQVVPKEGLLFYASFDQSTNADFARGDPRIVGAADKKLVEGRFGRAVHFGSDDSLRVCEYHAKRNIHPDQGTIAFYFKPDWSGEDYRRRDLFFCPGAKNQGTGVNAGDSLAVMTMRHRTPHQELWLWYDDHGGSNNTVKAPIVQWRPGRWHHVAVTWESDGVRIFLDGELAGWRGRGGAIGQPGDRFFVGASRNGASCCEGTIDELCIYGRVLSLGEIRLLTGKPEFLVPKIRSVTLLQTLFFQSQRRVPFHVEMTGQVHSQQHRLTAMLSRENGSQALPSAQFPAATGQHALEIPRALPENGYALEVTLTNKTDEILDQKSVPLRVIEGPFDRDRP